MRKLITRKIAKVFLLISLLASPILSLSAQEQGVSFALIPRKGASALGVNINAVVPLFVAPLGMGGQFSGSGSLGVNTGGLGSLIYQFFLLDTLSIGGELKYDFLFDKNYRLDLLNPELNKGYIMHIVPLVFKVSQYFDIIRQFSIFVEGNVGGAIVAYGEEIEGVKKRTVDFMPALGFGFGGFWNINSRWSLGLGVNWWSYFEFGGKGSTPYVFNTIDIGLRLNFLIQG